MCGIAGRVNLDGSVVRMKEIKRMTDAISYRGPDDEGQWSRRNVGLGSRRLAIIDLSPGGHMPMSYANDRYVIVFNGEIYNFREEKKKLEKKGYTFISSSDTEVILALYQEYGISCLKRLRGMFAFAIWDNKCETMFLARDRVGKKPLKYYFDGERLIFGSELKAILTQKEVKAVPDLVAIHHYLTLQYVPAPLTGFLGINKLEAGHYLWLDTKHKKLTKKRYWRLDYSKKLALSEDEWCEEIMDKLRESVKLRLIADVPLGAFLSGGIDSSAIVALMSQMSDKPVKTFSIGFKEKAYDETKYSRLIAKTYKTDHTEFIVKPDAMAILPDLVAQYEEPYADSSALPTYYLSQLTRKYVTVALNGDGGDENFAGYGRYSVQKFGIMYERFKAINKLAIPLVNLAGKTIPNTFFNRMSKFAQTMEDSYQYRYLNYLCYFSNDDKEKLYTKELQNKVQSADTYDWLADHFVDAKTKDKMDQTLYTDMTTYLPDDLLVKVDIATMANSLEARSPFLDHKLLELTAKIPFSLKLKGRDQKKYILKRALSGLVPGEVMDRRKMGFGVPIDNWFRGSLKKYALQTVLSKRALSRGLFREEAIREIFNIHLKTEINMSPKIWALLTLELWYQKYFD